MCVCGFFLRKNTSVIARCTIWNIVWNVQYFFQTIETPNNKCRYIGFIFIDFWVLPWKQEKKTQLIIPIVEFRSESFFDFKDLLLLSMYILNYPLRSKILTYDSSLFDRIYGKLYVYYILQFLGRICILQYNTRTKD